MKTKTSFVYLGFSVAADGAVDSEVARRLGMAEADFRQLQKVWRHTALTKHYKYKVYSACVVSRLLYGMQALCLGKAAQNKMDGFHARCLRKICGIEPAFYNRVSNATVLQEIGAVKLSSQVREQQLAYLGKLARRPPTCPVRQMVFEPDGSQRPVTFERRRGRPRQEWTTALFRIVDTMFASSADFWVCVSNETAWRVRVRRFCRAKPT